MKNESVVNVLGVGISPTNLHDAAESILEGAARPGFTGYVTVTGVHGVMESQKDEELKKIHNRSFKTVPDGMPMVWIGHLDGFAEMSRVYGPDLMLRIFGATESNQQTHFLFGGGEGVVEKLTDNLGQRFPGAKVVGTNTPPFRPLTDSEDEDLRASIEKLRPHFFWVGLSTPKQERFMAGFLEKHKDIAANWDHGLVMLGVGAAFDFHAGLVPQAPSWMQASGLEWLYRLTKEPKRLWKRYLSNNPRFVSSILLQKTGIRRHVVLR